MKDYNCAIREQFEGNKDKARSIYLKLLDSPLLSREVWIIIYLIYHLIGMLQTSLSKDLAHLKYVTLKNLASIERERDCTKDDALRHFAEATELDFNDPSLWYQIGNLALEQRRLVVARQVRPRRGGGPLQTCMKL